MSDVLTQPIMPFTFPKFIYLNGPIDSGKFALADHLKTIDSGVAIHRHKLPLWETADTLQAYIDELAEPLDFDSHLVTKQRIVENAIPTWSDYLAEQETLIKLYFGSGFFASTVATFISKNFEIYDTFVFPDINSLNDLEPLIKLTSLRNQVLIRIEGDSLSWDGPNGPTGHYVFPEIASITLTNNGDTDAFISAAVEYLTR